MGDCCRFRALQSRNRVTHITNCLRLIRNTWHFHYALVLVFKVVCGGFGIALLAP
ncbi:DUF3265 domain-containing protein [Vibrio chagasii]|uniref:DUF3265 domain-containing protein n=1 Tax=Vibrio chagasii TaxID=170679 RepID=A0A7V7TI76_9VIBR|nr:DUF3265 domain-containing protein [Vibrio chagasii]